MMGRKEHPGSHLSVLDTKKIATSMFISSCVLSLTTEQPYDLKEKNESVVLKDAISLVVQPRRQGSKARDETANLIEKVGWAKK